MKKFLLAATLAVVTLTSLATASEAHHRWGRGHYWGPSFGIVLDAGPRYAYADDDYCFVKKVKKINRWGERVVKFVTVCR